MICVVLSLPKLLSEQHIPCKGGADSLIEIVGLPRLPAGDLPGPLQDMFDPAFHCFQHHFSRLPKATGILINTFDELETEAVEALKEGKIGVMPSLCLSILSHSMTGGFLSHCRWNSTLKCVSYGFPIIGWTLFAEQRLNMFMLVNRNKIAVDLKLERDWFVRRGEVERAVRALMEGEEGITSRENMRKMKENEMPKIRIVEEFDKNGS